MDITEALDQIIFKYHLDKYYPNYRNMYEAKKILRRLVREIVDAKERVLFVCDEKMGNDIIQGMAGDYDGISFYLYTCDDLKTLEPIRQKRFDRVYLTSFYDAEYALKWFWQQEISCEWIYDIFEQEGLCLEREFYAFHRKIQPDIWVAKKNFPPEDALKSNVPVLELFIQKMKYEHARSNQAACIALEKCLFLCIYLRDFGQAKQFSAQLEEMGRSYGPMWEEIQVLLDDIRERLRARKEQDIVLYWLDAIPYEDGCGMPYLKGRMDASVCFERAYSSTSYTTSTMRALFIGKTEFDDHTYRIEKITDENSPLIQLLKSQGYDIQIISEHFQKRFERKYLTDHVPTMGEISSIHLWNGLRDILSKEKKVFLLIHIMDAHFPYFSNRYEECTKSPWMRCIAARQAIDEQLAFYDSFLGENAFRIYMSDHGNLKNGNGRYHILLNFFHRGLRPQKVTGLYSTVDFTPIMRQMLVDGKISAEKLVREYVEIEELDYYNYALIKERVADRRSLISFCFARRGVIDQDHFYIRFRRGKEFLFRLTEAPPIIPNLFCAFEPCDQELLPYYRGLTKEFPDDLDRDEKFRYSRYLYQLYDKALKTSKIRERVCIINELLEGYPPNSVAIRTGGEHSAELYCALSRKNQDKIWGFINLHRECMCQGFHLPVVLPDQIPHLPEKGVKAVILSSWDYLERLRAEASGYENIDVLDIYALFDKRGLHCDGNFYEVMDLQPEDFDIGFPPEK